MRMTESEHSLFSPSPINYFLFFSSDGSVELRLNRLGFVDCFTLDTTGGGWERPELARKQPQNPPLAAASPSVFSLLRWALPDFFSCNGGNDLRQNLWVCRLLHRIQFGHYGGVGNNGRNGHEICLSLLLSPIFSHLRLEISWKNSGDGRSFQRQVWVVLYQGTPSSKPMVLGVAGNVAPTRGILPFSLLWTDSNCSWPFLRCLCSDRDRSLFSYDPAAK